MVRYTSMHRVDFRLHYGFYHQCAVVGGAALRLYIERCSMKVVEGRWNRGTTNLGWWTSFDESFVKSIVAVDRNLWQTSVDRI